MRDLYYSTGQAANELGVSQDRIRALCASGMIESLVSPGGQRRIAASVVERLRQNGVPAIPHPLPEIPGPSPNPSSPPTATVRMAQLAPLTLETMRVSLEKLYAQDQELHRSIDGLRSAIWYVEQLQNGRADAGLVTPVPQREAGEMTQSFYSTGQVANKLGVGREEIVRLCDVGSIKAGVTHGGRRRIPLAELERLQEERASAVSHRHSLSAVARKHISDTQKKRWAEYREQKAAAMGEAKPKKKFSATGLKRVAAAQRKRWAEYHNQGSSRIGQILEAVGSKHIFSITDLREDENLRKVIPAAFLKTAIYSTLGRAVKRGVLTHEGNGVYRVN